MQLKHFATDQEAERDGVWVYLGGGISVRVARAGNPRFQEELRRQREPYHREIQAGIIDSETTHDIYLRTMANAVLLDWEGIQDIHGEPVDYSKEAAYEALRDNPDFRRVIDELAQERETFRLKVEEDEAGN